MHSDRIGLSLIAVLFTLLVIGVGSIVLDHKLQQKN